MVGYALVAAFLFMSSTLSPKDLIRMMIFKPVFLLAALLVLPLAARAQTANDGHLFDQGRAMTERSPRASDVIDRMKGYLGQWDVAVTTYPTDTTTVTSQGQAEVTYMNRGYAYQERLHVPGYDAEGTAASMMSFLSFDPTNNVWALGEASSYTESISMYNGDFEGGKLTLGTVLRERGGTQLTHYRLTYTFAGSNQLTTLLESSTGNTTAWKPVEQRVYQRRTPSDTFMATMDGYGAAASDLPEEAHEFDFLLGTWDAVHNMLFGGQWIQFPTNATAVRALGGSAILEHSWFDLDPNLPDAATSIIRIYNRSMRRWESLYLQNRSNSLLFFGGAKDGEDLVLHMFESHTADPPISRFVFHDIGTDTYAWYAQNSTDRGRTFNKTWTIEFTRRTGE